MSTEADSETGAFLELSNALFHANALAARLDGAVHALHVAGLDDYARRAERIVEHLRLQRAQLEALSRRVAGGEP